MMIVYILLTCKNNIGENVYKTYDAFKFHNKNLSSHSHKQIG